MRQGRRREKREPEGCSETRSDFNHERNSKNTVLIEMRENSRNKRNIKRITTIGVAEQMVFQNTQPEILKPGQKTDNINILPQLIHVFMIWFFSLH